jgi:hypothetical protein
MNPDIVGICVTVGVSVILAGVMIGLAVFLGLRSFTDSVGKKVSNAKDSIVGELSPIRDRLITIDERTDTIWRFEMAKATSSTGTVEKYLKNFGKTTITAEPGKDDTAYIVEVEKGTVAMHFSLKIAEETSLNDIEREMFGRIVGFIPLRPNRFRLQVPSTDPKVCTKYMSIFLKWLDTEYVEALPRLKDFESGIEI